MAKEQNKPVSEVAASGNLEFIKLQSAESFFVVDVVIVFVKIIVSRLRGLL